MFINENHSTLKIVNYAIFIILFQSRSVLQQYAASVATRGIMHSNTARARHNATGGSLGWKPLHKPQCYTISKLVSTTSSHMYLCEVFVNFNQFTLLTHCIQKTLKQVLWQTVKTQMKCTTMLHFIRVCTVC